MARIKNFSTFAWFTATSTASVTNVNSSGHTITSHASTFSDVTYQIQVSFKSTVVSGWGEVDLTDPDGATYALDGANRVQTATAAGVTYQSYTPTDSSFDIKIWADSADPTENDPLSGDDLTTALANLSATTTKTYDIQLTGGDNVRVSLIGPDMTKPESDPERNYTFAEAFSGKFENTITIGRLSFSDGAAAYGSLVKFYWSVSGNSGNTVPTIGSADENSVTTNGGVITSLVLHV